MGHLVLVEKRNEDFGTFWHFYVMNAAKSVWVYGAIFDRDRQEEYLRFAEGPVFPNLLVASTPPPSGTAFLTFKVPMNFSTRPSTVQYSNEKLSSFVKMDISPDARMPVSPISSEIFTQMIQKLSVGYTLRQK
jgi:hypothetical protein